MNKVVVITGATGKLGLQLSLKFSWDYLATMSRNNTDDNRMLRDLHFRGNLISFADIDNFINAIKNKWGHIDTLINNAGILGDFKGLTEYTEEEIDRIVDINIKGTFYLTQQAIKLMSRPGYIINIGSTRSISGAPNKSLYTMTKFAMRGLTQCINEEYKSKGIYSTIICPGSFETVNVEAIADIVHKLTMFPINDHVPEIIIGGVI